MNTWKLKVQVFSTGKQQSQSSMIAVFQLQPQVRVRHSFTGAASLERKATVLTNC